MTMMINGYSTSSVDYVLIHKVTTMKLTFGLHKIWGISWVAEKLSASQKVLCSSELVNSKNNAVPLQAWSGPEGSRKLRFPDFMTTAQDVGKVVSLMHRPP